MFVVQINNFLLLCFIKKKKKNSLKTLFLDVEANKGSQFVVTNLCQQVELNNKQEGRNGFVSEQCRG